MGVLKGEDARPVTDWTEMEEVCKKFCTNLVRSPVGIRAPQIYSAKQQARPMPIGEVRNSAIQKKNEPDDDSINIKLVKDTNFGRLKVIRMVRKTIALPACSLTLTNCSQKS